MTTPDDSLEALARLLETQGLSVEDLAQLITQRPAPTKAPKKAKRPKLTVAEYIATVSKSHTQGTRRSYAIHFRRLIGGEQRQCECRCATCVDRWVDDGCCQCTCATCRNAFGFTGIGSWAINDKAIDHALLTDLTIIAQRTATKRAIHQNRARAARGLSARSTSGQGGQEMCATALRGLFSAAFEDGKTKRNPAARLNRGARGASRRHALSDDQLAEVFAVVAQGGDDPALDQLLFWSELELGARRGGILGLTMGQLHDESQMISLLEKGNKERLQPCSVELLGALRSNAEARGGDRCAIGHPDFDPAAPVLYFKDSTPAKPHPVTSRRFDTLHRRIQLALPWANDAMFSGHALRHTSATMIERIAGFQSAQRFLGHHPNKPTDTYTIASPEEVATAWSTMTGKAHPAVQSNSISRGGFNRSSQRFGE